MSEVISRFGLLDVLRDLAKRGASLEASLITTYSLNAMFYEEVLLRALERAGSRLNVLLVDAKQLSAAFQDPVTRPRRAGRDYLLLPVDCSGAFHPKISILLSQKKPLVLVGSHNVTESGYARNDEVTVCWGHGTGTVPRQILDESLTLALDWARTSNGSAGLIEEVTDRLLKLSNDTPASLESHATFLGWRPEAQSLLDELKARIEGPVNRISVVSPYFDMKLDLLRELSAAWRPSEIVVGIQSQSALLLQPELAPVEARFVEFAAPAPSQQSDAKAQAPFLHGKVIAFETGEQKFVVLGSANASAPAWLQSSASSANAEAVAFFDGDLAERAFEALGLANLASLPSLPAETLLATATRSREAQRLSRDDTSSTTPVMSATKTDEGWLVPGLLADECRSAVALGQDYVAPLEATFSKSLDGALVSFSDKAFVGGLRIDGEQGPLAYLILNDAPHLKKLMRPKDAGRLLDALGRLGDDYGAFTDLFDLFERHVLGADPDPHTNQTPGASKAASSTNPTPAPEGAGPRGISLASLAVANGQRRQLSKDDLVADLLKALIRDLAADKAPVREGDAPDIDDEDSAIGVNAEPVTAAAPSAQPGEWERLVTACRKRVGVLVGRLSRRLDPLPVDAGAIASLSGKVLTTICLLQKLRLMQPREGSLADSHRAPDSLVLVAQLRTLFKTVMRALYARGGLADALETNSLLRGSEDRRLLDAVMLWMAREIGVDFDAQASFNEGVEASLLRNHDRVDGLVAAASAAAHAESAEIVYAQPVWPWSDAPRLRPAWIDRHMTLGRAFQARLAAGALPTLERPVAARDIVVWRAEPNFPRLVSALAPKRASLMDPGDQTGLNPLNVQPEFLRALDFPAMLTVPTGAP